jgi:hypothetical protein
MSFYLMRTGYTGRTDVSFGSHSLRFFLPTICPLYPAFQKSWRHAFHTPGLASPYAASPLVHAHKARGDAAASTASRLSDDGQRPLFGTGRPRYATDLPSASSAISEFQHQGFQPILRRPFSPPPCGEGSGVEVSKHGSRCGTPPRKGEGKDSAPSCRDLHPPLEGEGRLASSDARRGGVAKLQKKIAPRCAASPPARLTFRYASTTVFERFLGRGSDLNYRHVTSLCGGHRFLAARKE